MNYRIKKIDNIYLVGYVDENGYWQTDGTYKTRAAAAARVNYLHGGMGYEAKLIATALKEIADTLKQIKE